jgi:hypothetical protein
MTDSERLQLFRRALEAIARLEKSYPDFLPFLSIHAQLDFLLGQATGAPRDRAGLARINLGRLAVHEVEGRDDAAADLFHQVSGEARKMHAEP